jgi:hypothetical protein
LEKRARGATTTAAAVVAAALLVACGSSGGGGVSTGGEPGSPTAVSSGTEGGAEVRAGIGKCLEAGGAEVTRERDEISAGYEEVASLAKDKGFVRIYILEDPEEARDTARQIEFELQQIRPKALALVDPIKDGKDLIGVMGLEQTHPKGSEFFPSNVDVTLAEKCAP